ncbi:MAG: PAS domain S-box protein [Bacteroidetes bacterium]|nr:PAS domain S-box protein [Bacteroidota bacterium]
MSESNLSKKELLLRVKVLEEEVALLKKEQANSDCTSKATSLKDHEEIRLFKLLLDSSKDITHFKNFKDSAQNIFKQLKKLIHADGGYIALLDKTSLNNKVVYLDKGEETCNVDPKLAMPVRGYRKMVYQSKKVMYHNDFGNSKWIKLLPEGHSKLNNILFAPMLINDEVIGLIGMSNKQGGFNDQDAKIIEEFTKLAVIALQYSESVEESNRLKKQLKSDEERFRLMSENSPVMIWESGVDAKCTYFNKNWLNFRGRKMEEEIGDGWTDGLHPDDYDSCIYSYLDAFKNRRKFEIQYRLKNHKGEYRWILDYGVPQYDNSNKFTGYIGSCIDITDQKEIEQIQKEKEEFYHALFEKNRAVKLLIDPASGKIIDANTAAANYYGYQLHVLKKMKITEINQLSESEVHNEMKKANAEARMFFEFVHKLADGSLRDVAVYSGPIKFKGKKLLYSIILDITDQKKAQKELQQSEEKYRNLYENTPVMLHSIDKEGKLISVSNYWLTNLGYSKQEVIGRKSLEFLTPESQEKFYKYFPAFKEKGKINNMAYQMVKKNGEIIDVLLSAISEKKADGTLKRTLAVIIDVTEQKKAQEALRKSEEKFKIIVNSLPQLVSYCSTDLKYLYVNKTYEKEFGIKQEDIKNQKIIDLIGEKAYEKAKKYLQRVLKGEFVRYYEKFQYKNGSIKHIDGQLIPHLNNGKVLGYYGVLTDISTYMEAREDLEKSEKEKNIILESTDEMIAYYDQSLNVIWANKAAKDLNQLDDRKIINKKCYHVWHNREEPCNNCPVLKTIKTGEYAESEMPVNDRVYKLHAYPVKTKNGEVEGVVELGYDITKEKKIEAELRKTMHLYRTLASNLPNTNIFLFDQDKRILIAEGSLFRAGIIKKIEFEDKYINELPIENKVAKYFDKICTEALKGKKKTDEMYYKNSWYKISALPILSITNKVIGCIVLGQDITQQKKASLKINNYKNRLQKLTRHLQQVTESEKSALAREIHDDLGQNLTFVKLNLALLQNKLANKYDSDDSIQLANAYDMVNKLIAKVKKVSGELRPTLIDDLGIIPAFEWQLSQFSELTGVKYTFNYNHEDIVLDNKLSINLFRILQEALTNCAKYAKASKLEVKLDQSDAELTFSISNNGVGIKKSEIEQINSYGIHGMRERVELFDGSFEISGNKKGTFINIKIPLNK